MTNPAADGGAGCQQSKVSIIYHLLKDTALCSHAGACVKRILISLREAAPALPSAGARLGAEASRCDSWPCRNGWSLCWLPWDQPRAKSRAVRPEIRAGMDTQGASPPSPVCKTVISPVRGESRRHCVPTTALLGWDAGQESCLGLLHFTAPIAERWAA